LTESAELKSCISATIEGPSDMNEATTKSTFGRPKGSTVTYYLDLNEQIELATKEAAKQSEAEQRKSKSIKARLAKGLLDVIITAAKDKYQIPEDLELNKDTIRKRVKRGSKGGKRGLQSPMLEVEPYLVELIIKLADMRTPITTSQGLQLANSLIKGTSVEEKVIEWKKKYCKSFRLGAGKPELGREYWQQFMKRNEHLIRSKKAVKFDVKRAEWCNYSNMLEMYQEIYKDFLLDWKAFLKENTYLAFVATLKVAP
jgi:hypothetical protein